MGTGGFAMALTLGIHALLKGSDLFQETLVEIRKLPPERQQQLAKLAARMTIRLSSPASRRRY